MEFTIDVRDYLTDSEIKEMISDGIKDAIYYQLRNETDKLQRFMSNISYECLFDAVSECIGEDAKEVLKNSVIKLMQDESNIRYVLFRHRDQYSSAQSKAVDMMNEIVEEYRELMEKRIKEIIETFEFKDVQDEIYELAKDAVYDRIFGKGNKE